MAMSSLTDLHGSDSELNLLDASLWESVPAAEREDAAREREEEEEEGESESRRIFLCNFCGRKFSNLQALGGHQNAHKFQRAIAKREKYNAAAGERRTAASGGSFYHPYYPAMVAPSRLKRSLRLPIRHPIGQWLLRQQYMVAEIAAVQSQLAQQSQLLVAASRALQQKRREMGGDLAKTTDSTESNSSSSEKDEHHGLDLSLKL